ncbi:UNVERIFIED_CONTAM: hypothetical protein K2H54_049977 [Gekko kuhli]
MKTAAFSRQKVSEELGWDSKYRTRELYGSTRPVGRTFGCSKEREAWYRDHNRVGAFRGCGKEGRQSVDPVTMHGNNLHVSCERTGKGHPEEAGFPTDCADSTREDYRKPRHWYGCSLDAEFGTSTNGNDWNTNHRRKGDGYNIYRKGNDLYPDGHSLDVDSKKGDDWYVDCIGMDWKYCQKEDVQYMGCGEFPLNLVRYKRPENHTVNDGNLYVLQEDQVSWSSGHGNSCWRLEPWCETPRPWNFADNVSGETESVAFLPRALSMQDSKSGCPRTRAGRSDWSLEWEDEAGWAGGTEVWQRNSYYRRTAPSALRHHRKQQGLLCYALFSQAGLARCKSTSK